MSRTRFVLAAAVIASACASSSTALADDASDVAAKVSDAIARGASREAIEASEAFADRGGVSPDVSFDRGLAYLTRVRSGGEVPGDLGRAAAAFEETRWLRPSDTDAANALELVHAEVARRRARGGEPMEVDANPSAWRAVVGLLPEDVWAILAASSSVLLTIGLALRFANAARARLAAGVVAALGAVFLVLTAPLAAAAREVRRTTATAVVVVPEARLLDDHGGPTSLPAVPEAAHVDLLERRGSLVRLRWGIVEGFTPASSVRIVRPFVEDGVLENTKKSGD